MGIAHDNSRCSGGCCIEWMMESMQGTGAESREIDGGSKDIGHSSQEQRGRVFLDLIKMHSVVYSNELEILCYCT